MKTDKRKKPRRPLGYPAWIELDGDAAPQKCVIADVSETGVRLRMQAPAELPEAFTLRLSNTGSSRRLCQLVWRNGREAGIAFRKDAKLRGKTAARKLP